MNYAVELSRSPMILVGDHSVSPVITTLYVREWSSVMKLLHWIHNRRLDFILTVDPQGRGWKFEIEQPGTDYLDIPQILRGAGVSQ